MLLNATQRSITESRYHSLPVVYMDPYNSIFPLIQFFHGFVDLNYVDYTVVVFASWLNTYRLRDGEQKLMISWPAD